jgi:ferredoxin-type protein NapH
MTRGVGREAVAKKGWLRAHKWLLLRRASQLGFLALFLAGPWFGLWIVKGNLSSSLTLGVLPLTDPFMLAQSLAAGHVPYAEALIGAAIVAGAYLVIGGRVYCSWVCPVNMVTDAAAWLRRRLGIQSAKAPSAVLRYWLLAVLLVVSFMSGTIAWEWVNPVSMTHRAIIFGVGAAWAIILGVFLYDLLLGLKGWCGHVCPVGAAYSLLNFAAIPRVSAAGRARCNDCMDCFAVCPEPQVIRPALKGAGSPVIAAINCTTCGRCVDVCSQSVFRVTTRFDHRRDPHEQDAPVAAGGLGGGSARPVLERQRAG